MSFRTVDKFESLLDKMCRTVTSAPLDCQSEDCVLRWVIQEVQVIQSIYDSALDGGLTDEELARIEELYKFKLEEVLSIGMAALGAKEV